jgi:hypothetical protein
MGATPGYRRNVTLVTAGRPRRGRGLCPVSGHFWRREQVFVRLDSPSKASTIRLTAETLRVQCSVGVRQGNMNTKATTDSKLRVAAKGRGRFIPPSCSVCEWRGPSGECLDKVIKSGRCGDWVWYVRGDKQFRRRWFKPKDRKTAAQQRCRERLAAASKEYNEALTDEQQLACVAAGAKQQSRRRLDQSGTLTGQQNWVRRRCKGKSELPARKIQTSKT